MLRDGVVHCTSSTLTWLLIIFSHWRVLLKVYPEYTLKQTWRTQMKKRRRRYNYNYTGRWWTWMVPKEVLQPNIGNRNTNIVVVVGNHRQKLHHHQQWIKSFVWMLLVSMSIAVLCVIIIVSSITIIICLKFGGTVISRLLFYHVWILNFPYA
jgi:hypothetical protein